MKRITKVSRMSSCPVVASLYLASAAMSFHSIRPWWSNKCTAITSVSKAFAESWRSLNALRHRVRRASRALS